MKKFLTIVALSALLFVPNAVKATDYTLFPNADVASYALPIYNSGTYYGSITQQIYWAEELTDQGATAGDINSITFYYTAKVGTTASALNRTIQIWLMEVANTTDVYSIEAVPWSNGLGSDNLSYFLRDNTTNKAGTKVYEGAFSTESVTSSNPINFNTDIRTVTIPITAFHWDGSKNIVMTVADVTNTSQSATNLRFLIASTKINSTSYPRFAYTKWASSNDERLSWTNDFSSKAGDLYPHNTSDVNKKTVSGQASERSYANKVTFSITTTIPAPTGLAASSITTSSARLSWNAAAGATGYNVQWGTNPASLDHSASNVANTYLDIDELTDGTTYYFAVQTITAGGTSAFSNANFNTTAVTITYKGIEFTKWNSTTALPSEAGNYYLNADVALSAQYTLPGDINLCLNGNDVYTETKNIVVPDEKTLALYDNVGGGRIYGYYVANMSTGYGLISVENGGELVLGEGAIENLYGYGAEEDADASYAICINNGGTFKLSGAPTISAAKACIYMLTMTPRITIESGKPLTNLSAYSVDATGQTITSGWANMSGADPNVYLVSAKSGYRGIILNESGEAKFVQLSDLNVSLNESSLDNGSKLTAALGNEVSLAITRSPLTNAQYNTICLPYSMVDDEMQLRFGEGYDLEEFVSSSLDGDVLSLTFNKVTSLVAGKPYLLQPTLNAPALSYVSVNIGAASPARVSSLHRTTLFRKKATMHN